MFTKKKKENVSKTLNPFLILFSVVVICAIASYFVTPGAYDRVIENGRTIVVADSYHSVERRLISFFDIFRSIPYGLEGAAGMMFLVLLVGGTIEVYNKTGAIDLGVVQILKLSNKIGSQFILIIIMILFSAIGGILGWSEQIIPFVPIIVSICLALGYDSLVGVLVSGFVCMIGFSVSPTNMYTVAISHQIAELPLFSGMSYRLLILFIFEIISMFYILIYAKKIKKDPSKSLMKDIDTSDLKRNFKQYENVKISNIQIISLIILALSFGITVFGLLRLKWQINEMAAVFLLSGILVGILNKMTAEEIIDNLIFGAKASFGGALIIGIARSIQWVLSTGGLIDPLINFLATLLQGLSPWTTAIGIFFVITIINAFIPSGSGKAMAIMPVLIPLADMIGITRQTAILAFQFGDGISNTFWFTNGTMLIFFGLAKVPLSKWYKIIIPLEIILCSLAIIFLIIAIEIGYGPF
ncbi:YfcC family protein [Fusobacterium perfoetens]|uniref:YfcC family protein n=1 Tax=Fusobacterium perfoetens TaxID=852 RepID=UPI00048A17FA|nr:TIGR00366 family protein [Fusobacterium perfoetens]MCI6151681.1 TIGR00366 family protein [Fusobacterium perfoetens]MDY3236563.1 TIGR00366 family protein [Fusobacterium perfoetens]